MLQVGTVSLSGSLVTPGTRTQYTITKLTFNQRIIRVWASKFHAAEGDEYGIIGVLSTLALAYSSVGKTCKMSLKNKVSVVPLMKVPI